MKHSQLGASKAHRWMTCPASVSLEATFPDEESFYAAEGTAAHALAEMCLKSQKPPESYMGVEVEGFVVDELMAYFVAMYVDFCNSQEGKGTIEQRWIIRIGLTVDSERQTTALSTRAYAT